MRVNLPNEVGVLPDFLIIGAARAGTTSLYQYLSTHPDAYLPHHKEPSFFYFVDNKEAQAERYSDSYIFNLADYSRLFVSAGRAAVLGEASTVYLQAADHVVPRIKSLYGAAAPNVKIIAMLREPVQRAWSMHAHMLQSGKEGLDFETAMSSATIRARVRELGQGFDYVRGGLYTSGLDQYWSNFENVKIICYDDFASSQSEILYEVCEFLAIDPLAAPPRSIKANISGQQRPGFWGFVYSLSKTLGRTPVKRFVERWAAPVLLSQIKNQVALRGIQKQEWDRHRMLATYGSLYAEDLIKLERALGNRGLSRERQSVQNWLTSYECAGA